MSQRSVAHRGRLTARPTRPARPIAPRAGVRSLGLEGARDALVIGPTGESHAPVPLIVSLHGAGGDARGGLMLFAAAVEELDVVVLAPPSRRRSWDLITDGRYGADAAFIDSALALVFASYDVDREHIAIAGFSDGASYALGLGLSNGDLFTHVIAFSPGFFSRKERVGEPRIFVSHGVHDEVLPIDSCSRRIVPALMRAGYSVRYEEFQGDHVVPSWLSLTAVDWLIHGAEAHLSP